MDLDDRSGHRTKRVFVGHQEVLLTWTATADQRCDTIPAKLAPDPGVGADAWEKNSHLEANTRSGVVLLKASLAQHTLQRKMASG